MAPLLAARVFFTEDDPNNLDNVQWTYLGIAVFVFILAVVFFFAPLPEVTDADMALQGEESAGLTGYADKPLKKQYKLFFGVLAQFCYVGAQVGVAGKLITAILTLYPELTCSSLVHQLLGGKCEPVSFRCLRSFCYRPRSVRHRPLRRLGTDNVHQAAPYPRLLPYGMYPLHLPCDRHQGRGRRGDAHHYPVLRILCFPAHLHIGTSWPRPTHQTRGFVDCSSNLWWSLVPCFDWRASTS